MNQCYLYSSPSGIELIEGDKMPVKPEFKGDYFLHYGPQKAYEAALKAAKASAIPVQNIEVAKKLIGEQIASLNPGAVGPTFIQPGTIYGPFTVEYEIKECNSVFDFAQKIKVAILL